ncbi:hypothetical protein [Providencia alcalifaciens]|nr:hypothetical protein [Providencia alcalifaciens]CAG9416815.1 hypothetical protein NVI2019_PLFLNFOB_01447 [Providencia alcalifaciens]CAG9420173.1 hypothetical protein NVI2019_OHEONHNH_01874 [Providencia alcalifaciens]CAG9424191.1 hypothetical protein NVI2019_KOLGMIGM_02370 [Providencia alcalifaciens]CAG9425195.1 hypothetical protein NVI2019_OGMBKCAO_02370 [Providencia alcalifaciens]CAG9425490.1 hypothetical protein NVI2019_ANGEOOBF_02369 [Providencia alcalifaciens]
MIFGDKTLVPHKNGLSNPKNASEDRNYPDFEYCITSVHMKSKLVSAITNHSVSSKKFIESELKKSNEKHSESRKYFESLFDFEESISKEIRVEIDTDSLSDDLYCLSNFDGEMLAVKPKSIHLILKESNPENAREDTVGYCYFDDKREKREYSIQEGRDSLEILLPVSSEIFSNIFNGVKNGDNTIYVSVYFPAYADTIDRMSAIIAPSTCVIDASYMGDNFVTLKDISLLSEDIYINDDDNDISEIETNDSQVDDNNNENINEISSKLELLDKNTYETTMLLTSINTNIRTMSFLLIFLVALFLFKFVW